MSKTHLTKIVVVLFLHFVADFIFQTRWQATNKSKRWDALAFHCATYAAGMCGPCVIGHISWMWLAFNSLAHFFTDAVTSCISSACFQRGGAGNKWFWITIGFDQWIHAATLIATLYWIGGLQ